VTHRWRQLGIQKQPQHKQADIGARIYHSAARWQTHARMGEVAVLLKDLSVDEQRFCRGGTQDAQAAWQLKLLHSRCRGPCCLLLLLSAMSLLLLLAQLQAHKLHRSAQAILSSQLLLHACTLLRDATVLQQASQRACQHLSCLLHLSPLVFLSTATADLRLCCCCCWCSGAVCLQQRCWRQLGATA
jgi:hypothetical protein